MHTALHQSLTEQWVIALDCSIEAAQAIAAADAQVDDLGLPRDQYHMRPLLLLGRDRRVETASGHLQEAIAAANRGDRGEVFRHLGYGLHAVQDTEAHGPWWLLGVHWSPWLDEPKRTICGRWDRSTQRLCALERVTKEYLRKAMEDHETAACLRGRPLVDLEVCVRGGHTYLEHEGADPGAGAREPPRPCQGPMEPA